MGVQAIAAAAPLKNKRIIVGRLSYRHGAPDGAWATNVFGKHGVNEKQLGGMKYADQERKGEDCDSVQSCFRAEQLRRGKYRSRENVLHNVSVNVGEAELAAL